MKHTHSPGADGGIQAACAEQPGTGLASPDAGAPDIPVAAASDREEHLLLIVADGHSYVEYRLVVDSQNGMHITQCRHPMHGSVFRLSVQTDRS